MSTELVLTIEETAVLLRCHARTIRRNIKNGKIKAIEFGQTVRIPVAQFDGLLDEKEVIKRVRDNAEDDDDDCDDVDLS